MIDATTRGARTLPMTAAPAHPPPPRRFGLILEALPSPRSRPAGGPYEPSMEHSAPDRGDECGAGRPASERAPRASQRARSAPARSDRRAGHRGRPYDCRSPRVARRQPPRPRAGAPRASRRVGPTPRTDEETCGTRSPPGRAPRRASCRRWRGSAMLACYVDGCVMPSSVLDVVADDGVRPALLGAGVIGGTGVVHRFSATKEPDGTVASTFLSHGARTQAPQEHRMKTIGLTGTLATMTLALIGSAAAERAVNQHGSACAPVHGNNTTYPYTTGLNGIGWTGTVQTYFHCPAPAPVESDASGIATSNVKLLKMYVEDGFDDADLPLPGHPLRAGWLGLHGDEPEVCVQRPPAAVWTRRRRSPARPRSSGPSTGSRAVAGSCSSA